MPVEIVPRASRWWLKRSPLRRQPRADGYRHRCGTTAWQVACCQRIADKRSKMLLTGTQCERRGLEEKLRCGNRAFILLTIDVVMRHDGGAPGEQADGLFRREHADGAFVDFDVGGEDDRRGERLDL